MSEQIGHDADVVAEVKAITQVDAPIAVRAIVRGQRRQHPQLDLGRVPVFLHRADDLDRTAGLTLPVVRFHHLAKCALSEQPDDRV